MSLKAELVQWCNAVAAFEEEDPGGALNIFQTIADSSKIHFNIGMVLLKLGRQEDAVLAFQDAIDCDNFLSVAYFQRGVCHYILGNYEEAVEDFNDSLVYLRGNILIDYTQIGLAYSLYSCEILYNRALATFQLGDDDGAYADLMEALKGKQLPEHDQIDDAIEYRGDGCQLFKVPGNLLYKPPASKVENANKVDYLGQSKVIAAVDENDNFTGFKGATVLRRQQQESEGPIIGGIASSFGGVGSGDGDDRSDTMDGLGSLPRPEILTRMDSQRRPSAPQLSSTSSTISRSRRPSAAEYSRPRSAEHQRARNASPRSMTRQRSYSSGSVDFRSNRDFDDRGDRQGKGRDSISSNDWQRRTSLQTPSRRGSDSFEPASMYSRNKTSNKDFDDRGDRQGKGRDSIVSNDWQRRTSLQPASRRGSDMLESASMLSRSTNSITSDKLRVKIHYNDTRMVILPNDCLYSELLYKIQEKLNTTKELRIKFKDEDGSLVLMTDDDDLLVAKDVFLMSGGDIGKLELWIE